MRQAGVLAAAGLVALEKMVDRLSEDHERARRLARGLKAIPAVRLDPDIPSTNMVFCHFADSERKDAQEVARRIALRGIRVGPISARGFRLVTHFWIDDMAVDTALAAFAEVLG